MTLANIWFVLVAVLLTVYVILDGFDLGAGVLYPFIAKGEDEKKRRPRGDRPVLGRQRGLAPHRGRRHLRRLPHGLRHDLQRLLPGDHARAVRPHHQSRLARVPSPGRQLERRVGRRLLPRQPGAGAARRRRARQRHPRRADGRAGQLHRDLLGPAQPVLAARRRDRPVPARPARRRLALDQVGGRRSTSAPGATARCPSGSAPCSPSRPRWRPSSPCRAPRTTCSAASRAGCSWSSSSWACSTRSGSCSSRTAHSGPSSARRSSSSASPASPPWATSPTWCRRAARRRRPASRSSGRHPAHLTLLVMLILAVVFVPIVLIYTALIYKTFWGKTKAGDAEY